MRETQQQLVQAFANSLINGKRFETIVAARTFAESILNQKTLPGTLAAKFIDESVEQALVWAARDMVHQADDPIVFWEQCLDLYERQPALNTRTSTSILQQAYSTPIPIAYLAGKLAGLDQKSTVYEPAAGNGALLLLADPSKAIVNELNPERAAALRAQGFTVTQQDASTFLPPVRLVDRVITNPPFGSLQDAQGQPRTFRHGLLTTSQIDHAIALKALDLMKPEGKAVLILGGKIGDERKRQERYNTQLTRGFYRWLYKDGGYKVSEHFSIAGSLYSKQGTSFPIDVILIEGRGETQLKLPGVQPPRIYESYEALKEVLVHAIISQQQQSTQQNRSTGVTLQRVYSGQTLDTGTNKYGTDTSPALDNGASSKSVEPNREPRRVFPSANQASGVADRRSDSGLASSIRTPGGARSSSVDSQGNLRIPTNVPEQSHPSAKFPADGRVPGDELSGTSAMRSNNRTISPNSTFNPRAKSQLPDGDEFNRLADVDEHRREPTQSGVNGMADPMEVNLDAAQDQALENQVSYRPRSKAFSLETLAPAASLKGLENAFNKIEAATGMSVDEYVQTRLNEPSQLELFKHYAAEQIDSLALSIYNHEYEHKATLIGHDTGIGKTRIVCGLARYAQQQGLSPVVVTADAVLYADILARDAVDTGNNFNPLITNNGMKMTLRSSDGEEIGEINTPKNQVEKIREYIKSGNIGNHDCVFTTYGQLTGPASGERRQLLQALAPRSFLILDESHKAGGAAGEQRPETKAEKARKERDDYVLSCTEFFQKLVTQVPGFVASSATAIKDPIVAARLFYETTDLRLAAPDQETFTEHLKTGGVPLQQQVFAMWASSGGVIRCEKSYEGVEFGVQRVPVSLQTAENNSRILNLIWRFDQIKQDAVGTISADLAEAGEAAREKNSALGEAGATSTTFTSVLHNLTAVTALGLKAEETANAVIGDIEQGRKPIVMLFNTMESTIKNFIDTHNELADVHNAEFPDSPMQRIEVGDAVSIDAGELFTRYLEKSRSIKIVEPYLDELSGKQKTRSHRLTDEELGEAGVAAYNRAAKAIVTADWSELPISPIDYLKQKVEDAGYSMGEITGRTHILKYESANDIKTGIVTYGTREHGTAQKKQVMDDFQNGRLDAVITNSTTGYSLHAARAVADQRQRVMYLVQPHLDVNQVEQSIGRSHRSGQVNPHKHTPDRLDEQGRPQWGQYPGTFGLPVFKLVVGEDLPTEERAVAILMKKMGHLKANTTGNRSSSFGLKDMPDFINDYGNEVAMKLMEENPTLHAALDCPLGIGEELSNAKAIQKVTGRAVMLTSDEPPTEEKPYPSLARQAWLYDTLTLEYNELLAQKIALGENNLEAQKLDLQAEPVSRLVLNPGDLTIDSPFTKPAYLVEVQAKTGAKPNTTLQVVNAVRQELGFEPLTSLADHDDFERSDVREKGKQVAQDRVEELSQSANDFLAAHVQIKQAEISVLHARVGKCQEKLDAQLAIQTQLQEQLTVAEGADIPLSAQLKTQLQQQQPKLEKLHNQLSKAKLDLNGKEFQLAKEQRIASATLEEVSKLLRQFPVGQGVRLTDNVTKNSLYGVVAAVAHKSRANTPAAPSNWKLKLLVIDGVRSLSIKLDSLFAKGAKQSLEPLETAPSFVNHKQESSIYELFDERQIEAREKRYLVSGQVLGTQLTGRFAQVTDNQEQIHPVYLLRRGFDPEKDLDNKPIKLATSAQINQFLFAVTQKTGVVQTSDENLTILADIKPSNAGGIILKTPKHTAQGGLYFKDEELVQLTGDFVSKTEAVRESGTTKSQAIMTVSVPAERADEVLSYISQKWEVGAASHKNAAKEMLGQVLQSWESCNSINPDAEHPLAFHTPQNDREIDNPPSFIVKPNIATQDNATVWQLETFLHCNTPEVPTLAEIDCLQIDLAQSKTATSDIPTPLQSAEQAPRQDLAGQQELSKENSIQSKFHKPLQMETTLSKNAVTKEVVQLDLLPSQDELTSQSSAKSSHSRKKPVNKSAPVEAKGVQMSLFDIGAQPSVMSLNSANGNQQLLKLYPLQDIALKNEKSITPQVLVTTTQQNFDAHKQAEIVEGVNKLSDHEFLQLKQRVEEYFNTAPQPPSLAERRLIQDDINLLVKEIDRLRSKQKEQENIINSKGNNLLNLLRPWDKEYQQALAGGAKTMESLAQSLDQKAQKESKIKVWENQGEFYQTWEKNPCTIEMKKFAEVFQLPQIRERFANIQQTIQKREQPRQGNLNPNQQQRQQKGIHL